MSTIHYYKTSMPSTVVASSVISSQTVVTLMSAVVIGILPTSVLPSMPIPTISKTTSMSTSSVSIVSVDQKSNRTTQYSKVRRAINFAYESDRADLQVIARIRSLGTYVNDWNGPGTYAPTHAAVEDAESFARYLFSLGPIMPPYICASGDGEIDFYWKQNGLTLDLGFVGDGSYSYCAHLPNGQEIIEDEAAIGEHFPQAIVNLIMNRI